MPLKSASEKINRLRFRLTCKIPFVSAQEVLKGQENIHPKIPTVSTHWETASLFDHFLIASILQVLKPKTSFEIGTSLGLVTKTMVLNSPEDATVHTLDFSDHPRIGSAFRALPESARIRQHVGDSAAFNFAGLDSKVDFFFIDGSHDKEDVVRDSKNALSVLSDTGVIIWHDVTPYYPGVAQALESLDIGDKTARVYGTSCAIYCAPKAAVTRPDTISEEVLQ